MIADVLGVQPRTVERWERRRRHPRCRPVRRRGRPPSIPPDARQELRKRYLDSQKQWGPCVLACWARREGLGQWSPSTIARAIEDLKPPPKPAKPLKRYEIAAPNVMWSEDGASFKDHTGKRELVVAQDECSRLKVGYALAAGPATGADVRAVLETAIEEHGAPLILKRDGGSIFDEQSVMDLIEEHDITVVTSPPHYPRYNGKKERSFRDVRGFERSLRRSEPRLAERIDRTMRDLNYERPRPVLGGRTAMETYDDSIIELPDRRRFKQEVEQRQRELETVAASRHDKDAARRRAVEDVLSRYGLLIWNADVSTNYTAEIRT